MHAYGLLQGTRFKDNDPRRVFDHFAIITLSTLARLVTKIIKVKDVTLITSIKRLSEMLGEGSHIALNRQSLI